VGRAFVSNPHKILQYHKHYIYICGRNMTGQGRTGQFYLCRSSSEDSSTSISFSSLPPRRKQASTSAGRLEVAITVHLRGLSARSSINLQTRAFTTTCAIFKQISHAPCDEEGRTCSTESSDCPPEPKASICEHPHMSHSSEEAIV
jgi:hypothetical protein